jgi:hypothetical protein
LGSAEVEEDRRDDEVEVRTEEVDDIRRDDVDVLDWLVLLLARAGLETAAFDARTDAAAFEEQPLMEVIEEGVRWLCAYKS